METTLLFSLVLLPALAAGLAFLLRHDALRRSLLVATALAHAFLTVLAWLLPSAPGGWVWACWAVWAGTP